MYFFFKYLFWLCWVFVAVLRLSLVVVGSSLVVVLWFLIVMAFLVAEHRL